MRRTVWSIAVLLVFVLANAANLAVWSHGMDGPVKTASNIVTVLALPAWIPLRLLFGAVASDPVWVVVANATAVLFWMGVCWTILRVRGRLGVHPAAETTCRDESRRRFLINSASGAVGLGAASVPAYATMMEPQRLVVRRYEIPIRDLPASLDGLRVLHFSDPHVGPRMPRGVLERAVEAGVQLRPDLVALTGDYVHQYPREIEQAADLLAPLVNAARIGALGVMGNHDWWAGGPKVREALREAGVWMIDNDRVWLGPDRLLRTSDPGAGSLALVGLGDLTEDTVEPARAFAGLGPATPRLVLAHQPDTAELHDLCGPGRPRMDLMLSGHTHGGQVRIPFLGTPIIPSRFGQKYAGGLVDGPACPVLVSRGVGLSVLPVRMGVPPEIGLITLRRS
ncbi:MAG: metallophosphoesterase [Phycisphaerales bacterium]|nr:metallophosphoesterase [Planctomycetota bacterium]MCH8508218.1 metallophosphoesterase [Phycisphaerales bacterium]